MTKIVQGHLISAGSDLCDVEDPGAFQFQTLGYEPTNDPAGAAREDANGWLRLSYCCPRTGRECGGVVIGINEKPASGCPSWIWDGNMEKPTLTPSIDCRGGCGWHGYLTNGEFRE